MKEENEDKICQILAAIICLFFGVICPLLGLIGLFHDGILYSIFKYGGLSGFFLFESWIYLSLKKD